ncbi:MAG: prolipoprotein diacylglyceryl transferase [Planctomycetaceae bacterium]|nr:prolipoprotein diacylglyceryl transferase [Planctomycetaceae bacterium]
MHRTLFFIPAELASCPMFGFGLLLAVWAAASAIILVWQVWRHGVAAAWSYVPLLLLIGAMIAWLLPAISKPEGLPIRGYGTMIMLGVIAGTWLTAWRAKPRGIDPELIYSLVFWLVIPGILGARVFYVIHFWPEYGRHLTEPGGGWLPLLGSMINLTEGGLVVYGSLFGALLGLWLFVRRHRLRLLAVCDLVAPGMALGVAIGRIGCLMNGCCFGAVCDQPWAITFPVDSDAYVSQVQRGQMYGMTLSSDPNAIPQIVAVQRGGLADRAGLKPGDRLQSINGQKLPVTGYAYEVLKAAYSGGQPLQLQVDNRQTTIPAATIRLRSLPVHPTQIYSVIDALFLCVVLLLCDRRRHRDGVLFALMLSIYPVTRFVIEGLRSDEAPVFGTNLSIAQVVSLLLLACAVGLWIFILRRPVCEGEKVEEKSVRQAANCGKKLPKTGC